MKGRWQKLQAPEAETGWSREIVHIDDAIVAPATTSGLRQKAGVFAKDGAFVAHARVWRLDRPMLRRPDTVPTPTEKLSGRWLWGGSLFDHFGHFLVESLSRLWAAHHEQAPLDGILYIPKRARRGPDLLPFQKEILSAWSMPETVHIACTPTQVDHLVVPGQGFGLGAIAPGTPEMRHAVGQHFATHIPPEGPKRLYVSRSGLAPHVSGIIGESLIETALAASGYEIFHPEAHPIRTQISRYKAASQIIVADGSAAHLLGFVARPDQAIAYLPRRSFWTDGPITQITSFTGQAPLVPDTITDEWQALDGKNHRGIAFVIHDFARLKATLAEAGFIDPAHPWPSPKQKEWDALLTEASHSIDLKKVSTQIADVGS